MSKSVAIILDNATETVKSHWFQGWYYDGKGNFCMAGAVFNAAGHMDKDGQKHFGEPEEDGDRAIGFLNKFIKDETQDVHCSTAEFNDSQDTTHEMAVAMMEKATAEAKEVGL